MKLTTTAALIILTILAAGCQDAPLRLSPGEEQKQSAQMGDDLAAIAAAAGLPPGSAATLQMARSARAAASYTGPPNSPVNLEALLPPGTTDAWATRASQVEALRIKQDITTRAAVIASDRLADLISTIAVEGTVPADAIIHRAQAIAETYAMATDIAAAVVVPADPAVTSQDAAIAAALSEALDTIQAAAAAQAARRPTASDVVDAGLTAMERGADTADTAIDRIGGILENYGLLALIPGAGGVVYAARQRKKRQAESTGKDEAKHDAASAKRESTLAHQSLATANETIRGLIDRVAELTKLSPAPPATTSKEPAETDPPAAQA